MSDYELPSNEAIRAANEAYHNGHHGYLGAMNAALEAAYAVDGNPHQLKADVAELHKQLDGMAELNELLRMARDTVGNTLSAQVTAAEEHAAFWKDRSQTWRGEWVDVSNALGERDKEIAYLRGEIARLQERLGEPVIDGRK